MSTPQNESSTKLALKNIMIFERLEVDIGNAEGKELVAQLDKFYRTTEDSVDQVITWYLSRKDRSAKISRRLRFAAIMFTVLGGLFPILQGISLPPSVGLSDIGISNISQYGYLVLALAIGLMGFDKFFGYSSEWMRYMTTQLALQRVLSGFQMEWLKLRSRIKVADQASQEDIEALFICLKDFRSRILEEVELEVQTWVVEFKSNLAQMEKLEKKSPYNNNS